MQQTATEIDHVLKFTGCIKYITFPVPRVHGTVGGLARGGKVAQERN